MDLLTRIAAEANGARPDDWSDFWYRDSGATYMTASGMPVTADISMRISAVWAAYRALAEGVAALPCVTYRRLPRGKERASGNPLYDLMRWQPNVWQTAMEYWEGVVGHACLRGDHFSKVIDGPRGFVDQLEPLHPDRMDVKRAKSGRVLYIYQDPTVGEKTYVQDEIFHVRGMGEGGLRGLPLLQYAADSFGVQLARERYQGQLYKKAPMFAGLLEYAGRLDEDQQKAISASFSAAHTGPNSWHSVPVLESGITWKQIGFSARDAQFIESAEFGINDVARWFNVPVHILRAQKDPNHSNIEMFDQEFVMHTLRPWCIRIEQAVQRDLILAKDTYFVEFLLEAMIRATMAERYTAHQSSIQSGWKTRNEVREIENMNPLPGLDEPLQPLNMGTPGQLKQAQKLALAAAERVVRKEVESLKQAAPKYAGKPAEWSAYVSQFYGKHERFVQTTLQLRDEAARAYILSHRTQVLDQGLGCLEEWSDVTPAMLASLALEQADTAATAA